MAAAMRSLVLACVLCFLGSVASAGVVERPAGSGPRVGLELPALGPGSGAGVVFVDALKQAGPWSSTTATSLKLDHDGNVMSLAPAQQAERIVFTSEEYPAGDYTLMYDGPATFTLSGGVVLGGAPGRLTVRVPLNNGNGLRLRLLATGSGDYARNVRLILPGFAGSYARDPFVPGFVASLRGIAVLRFANWMQAQTYTDSAVWPARPRVSRATQMSAGGVAPEYAVLLANLTGADPWFTLPIGATDAYVDGIAALVHRTLDPRLHPIFEYGSNVWKAGTPANAYAAMAARNTGLGADPAAAAMSWYAARSTRIFALLRAAFGSDAWRIVRVVSGPLADSPSSGPSVDAALLQRTARFVDALAVSAEGIGAGAIRAASVARTARLAGAYGLPLIAYEGGESGDAALPQRREVTYASLETWHRQGGGLWIGPSDMYARLGAQDYAARHAPARVAPLAAAHLVVGDDLTDPPERELPRPWRGVVPKPQRSRLGSLELHGRAGLIAALGVPLATVDLTREGQLDWVALTSAAGAQRKRGAVQVLRGSVTTHQGMVEPSRFETYTWSDAAGAAPGRTQTGIALAAGAFTLSAPADAAQERVLRLYLGVNRARGALSARLGSALYRDTSLDDRVAERSGVYTFVYRAQVPGERLEIRFEPAELHAPGAWVSLRAATLGASGTQPAKDSLYDEPLYHNDLLRTGWNPNEASLNVTNVASRRFGAVATLNVDDNVLAQPLYLSHYRFPDGSVHNVLVVATEGDSVYEFDADTYATINSVNLGTPEIDGYCTDISPDYGITSTPVVDRAKGTIYLVSATGPTFSEFETQLHALDIGTLQDKLPPVEIAATETMSNGSPLSLDPVNQMNRPGLVLANNSLYLAFGSHCDFNAANISGWLLRYDLQLNQRAAFATAEDTTSYLLDSVWMAGFAPAVDQNGSVYVVTGNGAYDGKHDWGESALRFAPTLKRVAGHFTPNNYAQLTQDNEDFGGGGVMLLPTQPSSCPNLAVAMGKAAVLYLLDRDELGGTTRTNSGALQVIADSGDELMGGPAYFSGPSGQFVYYQTGDDALHAYALQVNSSGTPSLVLDSIGSVAAGYGGSTPIVSSDGQAPGTGIVWLVNRGSGALMLEAYDANDVSSLLFQGAAGTWSNPKNNAFVTPLVAHGKVYVPGTKTVTVFGLTRTTP